MSHLPARFLTRPLTFGLALLAVLGFSRPATSAPLADAPLETVRQADETLAEIMAIPAKAIPGNLLAEAHGVAIIPSVIKIGFIAGARRGHGVVLVRDNEGQWSLPQFITLTGGSVGWQAGIEGSDVVLVFTTQKGVQNLMRGKFTIGADVSAAAGPVGRNAAAATDAQLKAEIYSYSRSRGLFLGVSIDGSALEIDEAAHAAFYGSPSAELPRQIPQAAVTLRQDLVNLTPNLQSALAPPDAVGPPSGGAPIAGPAPNFSRLLSLRASLDRSSRQLMAIVPPEWQRYLALPREAYSASEQPQLDSFRTALARYEQIAQNGDYKTLTGRAEFQGTLELLRAFTAELSATARPALSLPPPPQK